MRPLGAGEPPAAQEGPGPHLLVEPTSGASASVYVQSGWITHVSVLNPLLPGTETQFHVFAFDCPEGVLPWEGGRCREVEGVRFTLTDAATGAEVPGSPIVTGRSGFATITVVVGTAILVTQDVATGTPGMAPVENPITVTAGETSGAKFFSVPLPTSPSETPVQTPGSQNPTPPASAAPTAQPTAPAVVLPDTGTGSSPAGHSVAGAALRLMTLALAALALCRRRSYAI
jgi:hypothetical protein